MKKKYTIILEKGPKSFGAYVPDLPGCVAVGRSAGEVRKLIREAIVLHLQDMRERGEKPPKSQSKVEIVELPLV
jgi:predicted RNase H-like HicB family nuclease